MGPECAILQGRRFGTKAGCLEEEEEEGWRASIFVGVVWCVCSR